MSSLQHLAARINMSHGCEEFLGSILETKALPMPAPTAPVYCNYLKSVELIMYYFREIDPSMTSRGREALVYFFQFMALHDAEGLIEYLAWDWLAASHDAVLDFSDIASVLQSVDSSLLQRLEQVMQESESVDE